jgi:hypothetical protein
VAFLFSEKNMTKQEILATIVECTEKLGCVPSLPKLAKMSKVNRRQIRKYWGSYARALGECNLARRGAGYKVEMEKLFLDWAGIARQLKKLPSVAEYQAMSQYSPTPLMARYGVWTQVPPNMKLYAEEQGKTEEWSDVVELIAAQKKKETEQARISGTMNGPQKESAVLVNQPIFGPLLGGTLTWPYPMIHGPVNEAGVIFLFGAMAQQLGYVVMRMQTDFPDCECIRRIERDRWQRVRIEFEYESRNFVKHGHEVSDCDLIICWVNNWPDCPVEVLELRRETLEIGTSGDRVIG